MSKKDRTEYNKNYQIKNKERIKKLRDSKKEERKLYNKIWNSENKDSKRENLKLWREQKKEHCLNYNQEYYQKNSEKFRVYSKKWNKENPGKNTAKTARYSAAKIQATPKWLTQDQYNEIIKIYENCPKGYHVDHIVPLRGKEVKGLHVPWNLQYLPAIENKRKSNKVL